MLELLTVVIIAVCGNWGWGDTPPPTAATDEKTPSSRKTATSS